MNNLLDLYTDYLISQNKYATSTGFSDLVNGSISHDKMTRFLNGKLLGSKELWGYIKPEVRSVEKGGGALILDDSIQEKPYTDENEIMCWHYSHAKGMHVKGANLLSCIVQYDDVSIPIGYEIIHKDVSYSEIKTKKVKRKSSITKNEHFRNLLSQAYNNKVLFEWVLADNWFGAKKNLRTSAVPLGACGRRTGGESCARTCSCPSMSSPAGCAAQTCRRRSCAVS